ncbi:hypothetical protein [Nocardiopsis xinjiangensis]|nr:hypothetical protein [Nocardiopsis xinjiangensis]
MRDVSDTTGIRRPGGPTGAGVTGGWTFTMAEADGRVVPDVLLSPE